MTHDSYYIFFSNLANELRIKIINELKKGKKNVGEISKDLNIEQSKISHALKNLRHCNIVKVETKGKKRIYSLNKKTILPMLKLIDKHATTYCNGKCCYKKLKENKKE